MLKNYTDEQNVQILLALLKKYGIRKVIASPGTTNMALVASMQQDSFFEMYSSVDERSAAYMACGLAAESGESVVLSCTGATASRNYLPGLTEAYYRKLPVLAITSTQGVAKVGHHIAQVIDRSVIPNDVARYSTVLPIVKDENDFWSCEVKVNQALSELFRHGGGPVHINLPTLYSKNYSVKELPKVRVIRRINKPSDLPELPKGKIAVFVGAHQPWTKEQEIALDNFCASNDAVVFCDHTSNYKGQYRILYAIVGGQQMMDHSDDKPDLLIHIGEITGDYYTLGLGAKQVWRVNEDGEMRDTFRKLEYVMEMSEETFFEHYINKDILPANSYLNLCQSKLVNLYSKIPELPLSNIWIASKMASRIPAHSTIHFGILNSLRAWNFFELPQSVLSASNVGGFGIDGNISSLLGASLCNKEKLYFGIVGDLAFFYDMNAVGNRHLGNNIRILMINNGKGTEFRLFNHAAAHFETDADEYIAAAGHYGKKSPELIRHYAQDLGFEYFKASNKNEFDQVYERFLTPNKIDKPLFFEVFTNSDDENEALRLMLNIEENIKGKMKDVAKQVLGQSGVNLLKNIMRK